MEHLRIEGEEEELEIQFDESQASIEAVEGSYVLVGRFLTDRPVRSYMMKEKIAEFWRPVCQMSIKEVDPNLYLFQFFHPRDMERVLKKGPWSFDGHTLILGLLQQGNTPQSVPLNHIPFWVQVHDVPAGCMSQTAGKQLGNFIGEYMEYDEKKNSNFLATYMSIRVLIDVRKPLARFKKIKIKGGSHEVRFKYERLGSFCYYCGLLGHTDEFCSSLFAQPNDDGSRMWSSDLRVPMKKNGNRGSSSKWLREDGGTVRAAGPSVSQNTRTATHVSGTEGGSQQHSKAPPIVNKLGATISLAEAFANPSTLFPRLPNKTNMAVTNPTVNDTELMEEELDGTSKKRSRSADTQIKNTTLNALDDCVITPSDKACMEDVQRTEQQQNTQHFLSAESGSQACRTK
jgi:hypothetical protein